MRLKRLQLVLDSKTTLFNIFHGEHQLWTRTSASGVNTTMSSTGKTSQYGDVWKWTWEMRETDSLPKIQQMTRQNKLLFQLCVFVIQPVFLKYLLTFQAGAPKALQRLMKSVSTYDVMWYWILTSRFSFNPIWQYPNCLARLRVS